MIKIILWEVIRHCNEWNTVTKKNRFQKYQNFSKSRMLVLQACIAETTHIFHDLALSGEVRKENKYAIYAYTHGPVTGSGRH